MRAIVFAVVVVGVVFAGIGMVTGIAAADQVVDGGFGVGDLDHWATGQSSLDSHAWEHDWSDNHAWDHDWSDSHDMRGWNHDDRWKWGADKWTLGWKDNDSTNPGSGSDADSGVVPASNSGGDAPVSATPEPSSLLLLTSVLPGLAGVGAVVRRRRSAR
jgi:hypothetical protein